MNTRVLALLHSFFLVLAVMIATSVSAQPLAQAKEAVTSISIARGDLDGKRVIFLGDSITAAGTHIGYMETILRRKYSQQKFDFICVGLPSETTSGLTEPDHPFPRPCVLERIDRVLEKSDPDIVIACYGMNDGIYHPYSEGRAKAYHDGMNTLISKCKASGAKVVIITPPAFDAKSARGIVPADAKLFGYKTPYEGYNDVLVRYGKWILEREDVIVVDVNPPLAEWLEKMHEQNEDFSSGDGVHPNKVGYMGLALAILNGMGEEKSDESAKAAMERVTADAIYKSVESRRRQRGAAWMRHTGYIRGKKNQQPEPLGDAEEKATAADEEIAKMLESN